MKDVYNSTGENNPEKERKVLIMFDDVIADMFLIKHSPDSHLVIYQGLEIKYFFSFHCIVILPGTKGCKTKYFFIMKFPKKVTLKTITLEITDTACTSTSLEQF